MKPNFRDKWRKPKGLHSKVRLSKRGNVGLISIGMSKGKREQIKLVHNIKELKNNKKVIIARIGLKKKKKVIEEAEKSGINVLNIKDLKEFLKKIEEKLEEKKKKKIEKSKKDEEKKKKEEKVTEKRKKEKGLDKKIEEEEIKKQEKERK